MSVRNIRFATSNNPEQQKELALQEKKKLEDAKRRLQETTSYYQYLDPEQQARVRVTIEMLNSYIDMLNTFIETGTWNGTGTPEDLLNFENQLSNLASGWQGTGLIWADENSDEWLYYEDMVSQSGDGDEELGGIITVPEVSPSASETNPPAVGLVVKDSDNVERIDGKTVGKDIFVTVTYKDGTKKTYVLKGLAVRPDVQIYIYARDCNNGIIMDFHNVVRVANSDDQNSYGKRGNVPNVILIGGKGDDIIIGSQGYDRIIGWEGNDHLYGMGGADDIYGDGVFLQPDGTPLSINDETGGADYIDGGDGADAIFGGGGVDTVLKDSVIQDAVSEVEDEMDIKGAAPDDININDIITGCDAKYKDGEYVISPTRYGDNNIDITLPDGYNLANATQDGDDIIITLVKMDYDEDGIPTPRYLRIRIKNGMKNGFESKISVKASEDTTEPVIIDFSHLEKSGNIFEFTTYGSNDTVLAPLTNLDEIGGVRLEDIQELSEDTVGDIADDMTTQEEDAHANDPADKKNTYSVNDKGEIEVKLGNGRSLATEKFYAPDWLTIDAVFYDIEGSDIVFTVVGKNRNTGEEVSYKIRVKGVVTNGSSPELPMFYNASETSGNESPQPIIPQKAGEVHINTGEGEDLIVRGGGSSVLDDEGDEGNVEIVLKPKEKEDPPDNDPKKGSPDPNEDPPQGDHQGNE